MLSCVGRTTLDQYSISRSRNRFPLVENFKNFCYNIYIIKIKEISTMRKHIIALMNEGIPPAKIRILMAPVFLGPQCVTYMAKEFFGSYI